jgi:tRNA modification GTPase
VTAAQRVVVLNKCDLPVAVASFPRDALRVSARSGEGIPALRDELRRRLLGTGTLEPSLITNARQAVQIEQAGAALERARVALDAGISEEVVLEELREARRHLDQIVGGFDVEELYERIFSTFCIGK